MNEFSLISFNDELKDFESYLLKYNGGKLQSSIDSGKIIRIEERLFIGRKRLNSQKKWLESFERLININGLQNGEKMEHLKQHFFSKKPFHIFIGLTKLDPNNKKGFSLVASLFNKMLEQPLFYLETIEKYNSGLNKNQLIYYRYKFLHGRIEHAECKFLQMSIDFRKNILDQIRKEDGVIERMLREVLLASEEFMGNIWTYSSSYSFEYYKSPLFVVYMEFVKNVQLYLKFANYNADLPLINKYIDEIEVYKKPFLIEQMSPPIEVKGERLTLPEMFKKVSVLDNICERLNQKGFVLVNVDGEYIWQGDPLNRRPKKTQLVALSLMCDKFFNKAYQDKEIYLAFTSYFNLKTSGNIFKYSQAGEAEKFKELFSFIRSI